MVYTIAASILVFGFLVLFHELGHFALAKWTGMRVDEFAIGFGPRIWSKKYGETEYSIRCIPLGGFNDIAGMNPADNDAGDRGYCAKPVWKRMLTILAGPGMNLILPIFIFAVIFFSVGVSTPSTRPELGDILPDKPAAMSGLKKGDTIRRINDVEIHEWSDIVRAILATGQKSMTVDFVRDGKEYQTTMVPEYDKQNNRPVVGIMSSSDIRQPGLFEAVYLAVYKNGVIIYEMLNGLVKIFSGSAAAELAGPIGVMQMTGEVAQIGFVPLLHFAAVLSLNLGIINLLPVPALDGGHFVTLIIEGLRGKPLGDKALHYTQMVGITLLIALMLFATKNDIVRIFFAG